MATTRQNIKDSLDETLADMFEAASENDAKRYEQLRKEALSWATILNDIDAREQERQMAMMPPVRDQHEIACGYISAISEPVSRIIAAGIAAYGSLLVTKMLINYGAASFGAAYNAEQNGVFLMQPSSMLLKPNDLFRRI